jgi:hypothetical protein
VSAQIYVLCGEERESLDCLIDRFRNVTIGNLIAQLNLPPGPITCRLVRWPDPDSPHPEEALAVQLFAKIAENEPYQAFDASTVLLERFGPGSLLA